jgi:hypoxanthine-guanine phosphoribosyltransferase
MNTNPTAEDHHSGPKEYIVTQTLAEHFDAFANIGLKAPDPAIIKRVEDGLVASIQEMFTDAQQNVKVIAIPIREQCHQITSAVNRIKKTLHNPIVVSTCPLLSFGADGRLIHLTRLIDIHGNIIAIGPRPYHDLPAQQVADMASEIRDRDVILVEDGAFTGSTVLYTLSLLKQHRARVRAIVLGIMFPGADIKIRKEFDGEIVYCTKPSNPLDWMPSHDFFPFVPNSGRVVGHKLGNVVMPVYLNYDNAALAMPYIRPYGKTEWASLPGNQQQLNAFSAKCLLAAEDLFKDMEEKRGEPILIGDIIGSNPVTYIPVSHGGHQDGFSREGDRVISIISGDREIVYS